jgi:hypothetical protein
MIDDVGAIHNEREVHELSVLNRNGYCDSSLKDDAGERHIHGTHRIVCWTFDPTFDINDPNMEVHHRDRCTTNNHPSNLEAMTKEQHQLITAADNPGRWAKCAATLSVAVERVCQDTGKVHPYTSIALAACAAHVGYTAMRTILALGGHEWRYAAKPIAGEKWYQYAEQTRSYWLDKGHAAAAKVQVSDLGRVRSGARATYGTVGSGNHLMFGAVQVSWLVCVCFYGPPLESDMRVQHRDGNAQNNRLDNIFWSKRRSQVPAQCWSCPAEENTREMAIEVLEAVFGEEGKDALGNGRTLEISKIDASSRFDTYFQMLTDERQAAILTSFSLLRRHHGNRSNWKGLQKILDVAWNVKLVPCSGNSQRPRYHVLKLYANSPLTL